MSNRSGSSDWRPPFADEFMFAGISAGESIDERKPIPGREEQAGMYLLQAQYSTKDGIQASLFAAEAFATRGAILTVC